MKLQKLSAKQVRKALSGIDTYIPGRLSSKVETAVARLLLSRFDTDTYSTEKLLKLKVLEPIMEGVAYVYLKLGFDEEVIKLFDSIKNSLPSVIYFVRGVHVAHNRPLDKSKVKQYILDTLIGPAWRDPNFWIWGRSEIPYYYASSLSTLSYDIRDMITRHFVDKYNRNPSIEGLLSEGLCIFNELPQDRLAKFFDALRRLMPYIRYLHMPTKYRKQHHFLVDDKHTYNLYKYDTADFPITLSAEDVIDHDMEATWTIKDKKLVITKMFWIELHSETKDKLMKKFYSKYPEQIKTATIKDDNFIFDMEWKKTESYPLPEDLQELGKIWRELL